MSWGEEVQEEVGRIDLDLRRVLSREVLVLHSECEIIVMNNALPNSQVSGFDK